MTNWIQTHSGTKFDFFDIESNSISINDIIHSLHNQCRYLGHTETFYSVLHHSVFTAFLGYYFSREESGFIACLLHDAHEAYVGDISSPFKSAIPYEAAKAIESITSRIDRLLYTKYMGRELCANGRVIVNKADKSALFFEAECMFREVVDNWHYDYRPYLPDHEIKKIERMLLEVLTYSKKDCAEVFRIALFDKKANQHTTLTDWINHEMEYLMI